MSGLIGEYVEAIAIGAIVLLNAMLGFLQEARAERAVLAFHAAQSRLVIEPSSSDGLR